MRITSKKYVGAKHVYDISVDGLENFLASGVVVHNSGARKLCEEVQPKSIEDLSAITAIYRPGPLKANVHLKYVDAKNQAMGGGLRFAHPVIEEVLGPTYGFIVYQESFMALARELGGFTPAESDGLRKTLVKKSLDTIGKKGDERQIAHDKFVKGAQDLHGVPLSVSEPLWKQISDMSVYCFNKSHSVSYAIDSYYAAWLYTYYPKEWLATVLQSETGHPDKLSDTISQIKQLGWSFTEADVNLSGAYWTFNEEANAFVPPLLSLKRIGETAVEEIVATRPFKDLHSLLWDREGNWYHSKMNKGAFEALCLVEAFASLEEMRTGKIRNHRQLHEILIGNYDKLKKGPKGMSATAVKRLEKKGEVVSDILEVLIRQTSDVPDWSREEKIKLQEEVMSSVDNKLLFPGDILRRLLNNPKIAPLTQIPSGVKSLAWFLVRDVQLKHTQKGKAYLSVKAQDHENKQVRLKVWGASDPTAMEPFTVWLCEAQGDEKWGPSTSLFKCRKFDLA